MKVARWIVAAAATAFALPAQAATTDPLKVIYLFSGVLDDNGGINAGVATSVHCTSFSGVTETLQFVVRDSLGGLKANPTHDILSSNTHTASTHQTFLFSDNLDLSTGLIRQGTVGVLATSINITCTAQVLDASAVVPSGFNLHGTRFNPIPGTLE